jgi:SlyX protein
VAHQDEVDSRLTELEIKASFTEDLVEQLNQVIIRQQRQIDLLQLEISHLRQQTESGTPATLRSLRDELPPHY